MRRLCDEWYPEAAVIRVVPDNLNTHGPQSLFAAYVLAVIAFYSQWGWADFPKVFRILGGYVVALPLLAALILGLAAARRLSSPPATPRPPAN